MITKGLNRWSLQHFAKLRARLEDSIIKLSSICTKELNQGYIYGIGELRRTKKGREQRLLLAQYLGGIFSSSSYLRIACFTLFS